MPDLRRDGLIEALLDFGIDMDARGLDVPLSAPPVIQLQDLSLNYQPAIRARLLTRVLLAGAAATFTGVSVKADSRGFWVTGCVNLSATGVQLWVFSTAFVTAGTPLGWNAIGDDAGQSRLGDACVDFFGGQQALMANNIGAGPSLAGYQIPPVQAANQCPGLFPLWVPGNSFLNIASPFANTAIDVSVALQMPSMNPGRLP